MAWSPYVLPFSFSHLVDFCYLTNGFKVLDIMFGFFLINLFLQDVLDEDVPHVNAFPNSFWDPFSWCFIYRPSYLFCFWKIFRPRSITNLACDELIMNIVQSLFIHGFMHFTHEYHTLKHVWHTNKCVDE